MNMEATKARAIAANFVEDSDLQARLVRTQLEARMEIAMHNPRNVTQFIEEATVLATHSEAVALDCIFSLPRGKEPIEGPTARFAEIIAMCWKNCNVIRRVVEVGEKTITGQGVFLDLENNTESVVNIERNILYRNGNRYNDDMITMTGNAATSIAARNATLQGIPKAFWSMVYQAARKVAIGDFRTIAEKRTAMLDAFAKIGVNRQMIFASVNVADENGINGEKLLSLRALFQAIRDPETPITVETAFDQLGTGKGRTVQALIDHAINIGSTEAPQAESKTEERRPAKETSEDSEEPANPAGNEPSNEPPEAQQASAETSFADQFTDDLKPSEAFTLVFSGEDEETLVQLVRLFLGTKSVKSPDGLSVSMQKKFSGALRTIAETFGDAVSMGRFLIFALDEYPKLSRNEELTKAIELFKSEQ